MLLQRISAPLLLGFAACLTLLTAHAATPPPPHTELTRLGTEYSELYWRTRHDRETRHGDTDRQSTARMEAILVEASALIANAQSEILNDPEIQDLRVAIETRAPVPFRTNLLADEGRSSIAWIGIIQFAEFIGLLSLGAIDSPLTWIAPAIGLSSVAVTYLSLARIEWAHPIVKFKMNAYHYPLIQTAQFLRKRTLKRLLNSDMGRAARGEPFLRALQKSKIPLREISACEIALLPTSASARSTAGSPGSGSQSQSIDRPEEPLPTLPTRAPGSRLR